MLWMKQREVSQDLIWLHLPHKTKEQKENQKQNKYETSIKMCIPCQKDASSVIIGVNEAEFKS